MSEFLSSIPLSSSLCGSKFGTLSSKLRPNNANIRNGKLQLFMCSFKPNTSKNGSQNQDMFGELEFKEKVGMNSSTVENGREIVELREEKKGQKSEDENSVGLERPRLRRGKQLMRRSNMLAKQVISIQSAVSLGYVSQLWVDTTSWVVLVVEVRPNLLSGESERFLLEDVSQVGDVVLVEDETVTEKDFKMVGLDTLVGYRVVTPGKRNIGKVSTYALHVEDVLQVIADTIVVHEAAASHIQRLTKGIWDSQNPGTLTDELGEYADFERPGKFDDDRRTPRGFSRKKSHPKMREEAEDDWELPMDYL
ncbi:uncharacterized protein LOC116105179 isoform X2 [Pistacia vera]|uniref:uncharacterized protein LOC116105179 isoform X2 n=1 Tax=Pistacia vera TaxID=55513 RepID=UPI001263341F|nr:uncharacterized protein LOC116105179 isoform X2 [Pistacia vera]